MTGGGDGSAGRVVAAWASGRSTGGLPGTWACVTGAAAARTATTANATAAAPVVERGGEDVGCIGVSLRAVVEGRTTTARTPAFQRYNRTAPRAEYRSLFAIGAGCDRL